MHKYGFQLHHGKEVQVEAEDIHEAISLVELTHSAKVIRGRCLDNYVDNPAEYGGEAKAKMTMSRGRQYDK
jgi:hypothetical protein